MRYTHAIHCVGAAWELRCEDACLRIEEREAIEIAFGGDAPVIITCEHASNRMPSPWAWPEEDRWITDMHWAWDIGARDLTLALAEAMRAPAVLPRFSRLLVDPNRALHSDTLFRDVADGRTVHLNRQVAEEDAERRISGYYNQYHGAIEEQGASRPPGFLLSIHSYTPVYEGTLREVEIGVLHCGDQALAERWREVLAETGRDVRIDEPYAGAGGFMYSAERHSTAFGCATIELEFRHDILSDPAQLPGLVDVIRSALQRTGVI
jgi:predicted N-formylglutamate amidohydrolase